jgi:tRNA(Arg) A34 adenosine deaminase TadA
VPVPERVKELSFREFFIAIASADGQFIAVGRDRSGKQVAHAEGRSIAEAEADLKSELLQLSNDFVDLPGAINLFQRAFPGGFHTAFYDYYERKYKADAAADVQALAEDRLTQLVSSKQDAEIAEAAIRGLARTNLTSHHEQIALRNALHKRAVLEKFGRTLIELLYIDIGSGIEHLSSLLGPEGAAKWPLITYFPFLLRPDRDMLLKPELAQLCAYRLGYELEYDPVLLPD